MLRAYRNEAISFTSIRKTRGVATPMLWVLQEVLRCSQRVTWWQQKTECISRTSVSCLSGRSRSSVLEQVVNKMKVKGRFPTIYAFVFYNSSVGSSVSSLVTSQLQQPPLPLRSFPLPSRRSCTRPLHWPPWLGKKPMTPP